MIPIGDKPILWHLMHYYSQFGHKDFVNLDEMTAAFRASGKVGCFLAVRPSFSLHRGETWLNDLLAASQPTDRAKQYAVAAGTHNRSD
jgi:hypothetical protein